MRAPFTTKSFLKTRGSIRNIYESELMHTEETWNESQAQSKPSKIKQNQQKAR